MYLDSRWTRQSGYITNANGLAANRRRRSDRTGFCLSSSQEDPIAKCATSCGDSRRSREPACPWGRNGCDDTIPSSRRGPQSTRCDPCYRVGPCGEPVRNDAGGRVNWRTVSTVSRTAQKAHGKKLARRLTPSGADTPGVSCDHAAKARRPYAHVGGQTTWRMRR